MGPIFCVTRISAHRRRAGPPTYVDMNHADLETQTADVISICGDRSRLISSNARRFRDHVPVSSITRYFGTFANAIQFLMHVKS